VDIIIIIIIIFVIIIARTRPHFVLHRSGALGLDKLELSNMALM